MIKGNSTEIDGADRGVPVYIGTYDSENSKGVYRFYFDRETGRMTEAELFCQAKNAKWVSPGEVGLAFPVERDGKAGLGLLELKEGEVGERHELLMEKETPCYILQDKKCIYTANYHEGTVMIYCLEEDKLILVKRIECGKGAGSHQILLHGDYLMVPCLTQHKIRIYDKTAGFNPAGELCFPEGSGPRHGVFNRAHTMFYVVSEWSNELFVFHVRGQEFTLKTSLSVLPPAMGAVTEKNPAAAAIRLTKEEDFLYISVRELDILAVIDLRGDSPSVIQHVPCGGKHPRDFISSSDEQFLLIANRFSGGIVSMKRDKSSGMLLGVCHRIEMSQSVSLALSL